MELFAQDVAITDWVSLIYEKGPLVVLFALFVYGLYKYVPPLVKGHLETLDSNKVTNERLSKSYETLTVTVGDIAKNQTVHHATTITTLGELKVMVMEDKPVIRRKPDGPHVRDQ